MGTVEGRVDYNLIKASERLSELNIKATENGYAIHVHWFRVMFKEGDWLIRRHTHSTLEFHFIKSGDCEVALDDRVFTARAGTFFVTAPGVYHTQRPGASADLVEYSLNCDLRSVAAPAEAEGDGIGWPRCARPTAASPGSSWPSATCCS
jgi:mannose-6-phosphate isomerase-like protein (cupin superfamily)